MNDKVMIGVVGYRDPKTGSVVCTKPIHAEADEETARERKKMINFAGQLFAEVMASRG